MATTSLSFDPTTCVLSRRSVMEGPNGRTEAGWDMRYFVLPELVAMLRGIGFGGEQVFGEFDGSAHTLLSPRVIVLARR